MISFIEVENFMSWRKMRFELSSGVNIICGVSDKGKSAIIKASELVRTNQPLGMEFVSDWIKKKNKKGDFVFTGDGDCKVTIGLQEGIQISRIVGKNTNEYRISTLKDPLKALNKQVPQEVTDLLNMSDINIQDQGDPYFIFNLSAPEIGRKLNKIASLSDIDKSFTNADGAIRALNTAIKSNETDLEKHIKNEKDLLWINQAETKLNQAEQISVKLATIRTKEMNLRNIGQKISGLRKQLVVFKNINKLKDDIWKATLLKTEIDARLKKFEYLEDVENQIIDWRNELKKIDKILSAKQKINQAKQIKIEIDRLLSRINPLAEIEEKIRDLRRDLKRATDDFNKVHQEYEKIKPDLCPLCKRPGWKEK
jgi:DNA repair ATPase RecN